MSTLNALGRLVIGFFIGIGLYLIYYLVFCYNFT